MSKTAFQSRISLDSGYATDGEMKVWECSTTFVDNDGVYTGYDITNGDVVAIDTTMYEPGTFTFYQVTNVVTPDASAPVIELTYMEINNNSWGAPDLSSLFGLPQTISRPSTNFGLLPVVSKDTQGVSDKYTEYVQNYNFGTILDKLLAIPKTASFNKTNNDSITLLRGMPVVLEPLNENLMIRAYPTGATARVVGLVNDTVLVGAVGPVISSGQIEQPTNMWDALTGDVGGLTAGKDYFLRGDYLGGLSKTPPPTGFIVMLGKAVSSTILDVDVETPIEL